MSSYNNKQTLVIVTGCAGAGKTTVGKELAKQLGFAYTDKDTITSDYTNFILTQLNSFAGDRESALYKEQILPIEYKVTFNICKEMLDNGTNVVLAIPFISQIQDWSKWVSIKNESGIDDNIIVKFIWLRHNIDIERINIIKRNDVRDTYKLEHWEEYSNSVNGVEPADEYNAFIYSNDCNVNLSEAILGLKQWVLK